MPQFDTLQEFFADIKRDGPAILDSGRIQSSTWHGKQVVENERDLSLPERMAIEWIIENNLNPDLLPYPGCPQQDPGR